MSTSLLNGSIKLLQVGYVCLVMHLRLCGSFDTIPYNTVVVLRQTGLEFATCEPKSGRFLSRFDYLV